MNPPGGAAASWRCYSLGVQSSCSTRVGLNPSHVVLTALSLLPGSLPPRALPNPCPTAPKPPTETRCGLGFLICPFYFRSFDQTICHRRGLGGPGLPHRGHAAGHVRRAHLHRGGLEALPAARSNPGHDTSGRTRDWNSWQAAGLEGGKMHPRFAQGCLWLLVVHICSGATVSVGRGIPSSCCSPSGCVRGGCEAGADVLQEGGIADPRHRGEHERLRVPPLLCELS